VVREVGGVHGQAGGGSVSQRDGELAVGGHAPVTRDRRGDGLPVQVVGELEPVVEVHADDPCQPVPSQDRVELRARDRGGRGQHVHGGEVAGQRRHRQQLAGRAGQPGEPVLDGVAHRHRDEVPASALPCEEGQLPGEHRVAAGPAVELVHLGRTEGPGDLGSEHLHGGPVEPPELDAAGGHRQLRQSTAGRLLELVVAVAADERHRGGLGIPGDELEQRQR
jgi:hypothetical protein